MNVFKMMMAVVACTAGISVGAAELPWNMERLRQTPKTWPAEGFVSGISNVKPIFYEGENYRGTVTRIFAWYGLPAGASSQNPAPGIVLVHGGGGTAMAKWVKTWMDRGYAAIAMDTCGGLPVDRPGLGHLRHDFSGPNGWGDFGHVGDPVGDHWSYHAAAAVVRGHSFLRSLPEVDQQRIGITGISWGGYLTCVAAGIDDRFRFAVPVYGCGHYERNEKLWLCRNPRSEEFRSQFHQWLKLWDASRFVSGIRCPILWCTGTHDLFFPLDSLKETYSQLDVGAKLHLSIRYRMVHGHAPAGDPPDVCAFADQIVKGKGGRPEIRPFDLKPGRPFIGRCQAHGHSIEKVELMATKDANPTLSQREWTCTQLPFDVTKGTFSGSLEDGVKICLVNVFTRDGLVSSSSVFIADEVREH